jgi:hypothetical protein
VSWILWGRCRYWNTLGTLYSAAGAVVGTFHRHFDSRIERTADVDEESEAVGTAREVRRFHGVRRAQREVAGRSEKP